MNKFLVLKNYCTFSNWYRNNFSKVFCLPYFQEILMIDQFSGIIRVAGSIDRNLYDFVGFTVRATDINVAPDQPAQIATGRDVQFTARSGR